jgi:hypothetical protein
LLYKGAVSAIVQPGGIPTPQIRIIIEILYQTFRNSS